MSLGSDTVLKARSFEVASSLGAPVEPFHASRLITPTKVNRANIEDFVQRVGSEVPPVDSERAKVLQRVLGTGGTKLSPSSEGAEWIRQRQAYRKFPGSNNGQVVGLWGMQPFTGSGKPTQVPRSLQAGATARDFIGHLQTASEKSSKAHAASVAKLLPERGAGKLAGTSPLLFKPHAQPVISESRGQKRQFTSPTFAGEDARKAARAPSAQLRELVESQKRKAPEAYTVSQLEDRLAQRLKISPASSLQSGVTDASWVSDGQSGGSSASSKWSGSSSLKRKGDSAIRSLESTSPTLFDGQKIVGESLEGFGGKSLDGISKLLKLFR